MPRKPNKKPAGEVSAPASIAAGFTIKTAPISVSQSAPTAVLVTKPSRHFFRSSARMESRYRSDGALGESADGDISVSGEISSRPSLQLSSDLQKFADVMQPGIKHTKIDVQGLFSTLKLVISEMRSVVYAEETRRSGAKFSHNQIQRKSAAHARMLLEKQQFHDGERAYNEDLRHGVARRDVLNQKILEALGASNLAALRQIVVDQQLQNRIQVELDQLQSLIDGQTCWARCFCTQSNKIRDARKRIEALKDQQDRLESDDIDQLKMAIQDLGMVRDGIDDGIDALERPLERTHFQEEFIHLEAETRAIVDRHNRRVSNNTMLAMLQIYTLLETIRDELPVGKLYPVGETGTPDMVDMKSAFEDTVLDAKQSLGRFYCAEPGVYKFDDYLRRFLNNLDKKSQMRVMEGCADDRVIKLIFPKFGRDEAVRTAYAHSSSPASSSPSSPSFMPRT